MALHQTFASLDIEELFYNITHSDTEAAMKLTQYMKVKDNINQKVKSSENPVSQTCLHAACHKGNLPVIKRLLDIGADPDITDSYQSTPLHNAAAEGNLEVVKLLVERGANLHKLKGEKDALAMARMYGKKNIVDILVQFEPGRCTTYRRTEEFNDQRAGIMSDEEVHQFSYAEEAQLPKQEAVPVEDVQEDKRESHGSTSENTSDTVDLKEKIQQLEKEVEQLKLNRSSEISPKETRAKGEVLKDRIHRNFENIVQNMCAEDHLDYLISKKTISIEDYEKLLNKNGQREKTRALMIILLGRPADQWVFVFMKSLEKHPATSELAKKLRR